MWHVKSWLACAIVFALVGCSQSDSKRGLVPVEGIVTFQNQPVKTGSVAFVSADGKRVFSGVICNGRYRLFESASSKGALPGDYRVAVRGGGSIVTMDETGKLVPAVDPVPEMYSTATTSGLVAIVNRERTAINFDLTPVTIAANSRR